MPVDKSKYPPPKGPLGIGNRPLTTVKINGFESPGIAKLSGFALPRKLDVRTGAGIGGASTAFVGMGLAKGKLRIELYDGWDLAAWPAWIAVVDQVPADKPSANPGGKPLPSKVLRIEHALLAEMKITAVMVDEPGRTQLTLDESTGIWSCEIPLIQWKKPVPQLSVPDGKSAAAGADAKQSLDQVSAALTASINGTHRDSMASMYASAFNSIARGTP